MIARSTLRGILRRVPHQSGLSIRNIATVHRLLAPRMSSPSTIEPPAKKPKIETSLESMKSLLKVSKPVEGPIVWIDCEMTGLDVFNDHIIEICCVITNGNLEIVDEQGYESTVFQPKEVLDAMGEWCIEHHTKSGLVDKVLANPQQTLEKVETELYDYIKKYVPVQRAALMAGNSIHMDKFFMMREFKKVIDHLHYRLIDVSTIFEFGNRHNAELMKLYPKKKNNHTARSDILESIDQLKWYRDHYMKSAQETKDFVASAKQQEADEILEKATQRAYNKVE